MALGLALLSGGIWAFPSVYPTGVTKIDRQKAQPTYVLFTGADRKTHLIDLDGRELRQWSQEAQPPLFIDPALAGGAKGHVLLQLTAEASTPGSLGKQTIGEVDWEGKLIWQWAGVKLQGGYGDSVATVASGTDTGVRQHHDWRRLPNGNTVLLVNAIRPAPAGFKAEKLLDDGIYEVNAQGDVVWSWFALEHLQEFGFDEAALALIRQGLTRNDARLPFDYLHFNNMSVVGPNKWFDAGDARFHPDNLIVCAREANFTAIIERKTGKVVWHLGPNYPRNSGASLPREVDQIIGQHDAHIIPKGLPGAGNLLVFDNQGEAGYPRAGVGTQPRSRVLEIDPASLRIVWQYTATLSGQPAWAFYSSFIGSARRLANGNTLIDEGMNGRFFQVTPQGEIVWEYVSPFVGSTRTGGEGAQVTGNAVYRAQPVPYDWVPAGATSAQSEVAFVARGGIQNWFVLDAQHLLVEDQQGKWFEATLQVPAHELPYAERVGFEPSSPGGSFGRLSSVVVKGARFAVLSLVPSEPPQRRKASGN